MANSRVKETGIHAPEIPLNPSRKAAMCVKAAAFGILCRTVSNAPLKSAEAGMRIGVAAGCDTSISKTLSLSV